MIQLNNQETIGSFIAHRRAELDLTRNALADKCGISRTEIIRIEEGGRKHPSVNNLRKLSENLSVPYSLLLSLSGYLPRENQSPLEFDFPALKTAKQQQTVATIIDLIALNPLLTDSDLDNIVAHIQLIIAARNNQK